MAEGLISGAVWFFIFLAVHLLWFHVTPVEHFTKVIIRVYVACLCGCVATMLVLDIGSVSAARVVIAIFYSLLTMACLFVLYMPFYYNIVASLSIQSLVLLLKTPDGTLKLEELKRRFGSLEIVAGRLETMKANGYLTEEGGRYHLTNRARVVGGAFLWLKTLWRLIPGG